MLDKVYVCCKVFTFGFIFKQFLLSQLNSIKQLVGGTELEDSQKQRFHISRSFSSDTCQGNRQNKECRAETAYKSAREKREVVSDWTKSVDQSKTKTEAH